MQSSPIHISKQEALLGVFGKIKNKQISSNSSTLGYEAYFCRLNNNKSYWKPNINDLKLNNEIWIKIDLKLQTKISKIRIQGTQNHNEYIKSLWIDYSDNGCNWLSYSIKNEIQCIYNKIINNNIYCDILIWPSINTRFIRIRPCDYYGKFIGLRFDIYGPSKNQFNFARIIRYKNLKQNHRILASKKIKKIAKNPKIIQVDCKSVIRAALNRAGLTYVGYELYI